jgi:hypothetical protein
VLKLDLRKTPAAILAIEDDSSRAAWLTSTIRDRLHAQLVVARNVREASRILATQIPDLVLVPSLLSPADEAALKNVLRTNPAAAHVQMLSTPLMLQEVETGSRGFLERFRREKTSIIPPDDRQALSFAEQIAASLKRALEQRPAAAAMDPPAATNEPEAPVETDSNLNDDESEIAETASAADLPSIAPQDPIPFNLRRNDMFALESGSGPAPDGDDAPDWAGEVGTGSISLTAANIGDWTEAADGMPSRNIALSAPQARSRRSGREAWQDLDPLDTGFLTLLTRLNDVTGRRAAALADPLHATPAAEEARSR